MLDPQNLRILTAIRRSKLYSEEQECWVSAQDLMAEIRRPVEEVARAMRDLRMQGLLEPERKVRMYVRVPQKRYQSFCET